MVCPHARLIYRFGPYFTEPVIAGINSKDEAFIAGADLIGCLNFAKDVVVAGTASDKLYGMAEGLWEPDMVRGVNRRNDYAPRFRTDIE